MKRYRLLTGQITDKTHITATVVTAFFFVTTSWYFSPNNNARSLSTLIVVNVNKDAKPKIEAVMDTAAIA